MSRILTACLALAALFVVAAPSFAGPRSFRTFRGRTFGFGYTPSVAVVGPAYNYVPGVAVVQTPAPLLMQAAPVYTQPSIVAAATSYTAPTVSTYAAPVVTAPVVVPYATVISVPTYGYGSYGSFGGFRTFRGFRRR